MIVNDSKKEINNTPEINVPAGIKIWLWGIFGSLLGIAPAVLLIPKTHLLNSPQYVIFPITWAVLLGGLVTFFWSESLHERTVEFWNKLKKEKELGDEEDRMYHRVPWMPVCIGLFERTFYSLLIGLNVSSAATFIVGWVILKSGAGVGLWSKGTSYGRAILFAGLLGNAMSVLFGVVAGLVIRSHLVK